MDLASITTMVSMALSPYLLKTGEKIAEKLGEELFPVVKRIFITEKEKQTIAKIESSPSLQNFNLFEQELTKKMESSPDLAQTLAEVFKLTPFKAVKFQSIINSYKEIREELDYLYVESKDAGISTTGDYSNRIALQERKLKKLEKDFFQTINSKN
jgi:hypothetical protein